jgi:hypothetical protein
MNMDDIPEFGSPGPVDFAGVEADYRAGQLTVSEIGKKYGLSPAYVTKKARQEGWKRDLAKRIEAEREKKISRAALPVVVLERETDEEPISDEDIVDANAKAQTDVILQHRSDLKATREMVKGMLMELANQNLSMDQIEALAEAHLSMAPGMEGKFSERSKERLVTAWMKLIGLADRTVTIQKLVNSLAQLIECERQALGIDKYQTDGQKSLGEFLQTLK